MTASMISMKQVFDDQLGAIARVQALLIMVSREFEQDKMLPERDACDSAMAVIDEVTRAFTGISQETFVRRVAREAVAIGVAVNDEAPARLH